METYLEKIQRLNKSYTYKDMDVDGITYNYLVAGDLNKEVITLLNAISPVRVLEVTWHRRLQEKDPIW